MAEYNENLVDTDFPTCPHCETQHLEATEHEADYDNEQDLNLECPECGKAYTVTVEISVTYSTFAPEPAES